MPQTIRKGDHEDENDIVVAEIVDLEKKKELRKYYVYVIEVTVKYGPKHVIYRRYNQFHNLSQILEERFPIEAGSIDVKDRTLPTLPGKKFLGRSAVKDVAEERIPHLNSYMKKLLGLARKINRDEFVQRFFRQNEHDGKPYSGSFRYRGRSATSAPQKTGIRPPPPTKKLPVPPPRPAGGPPKRPALPPKRPDAQLTVGSPKVPPRISLPVKPPVAKKPIVGPRAKALHTFIPRNSDELGFKKGDIIKLRQRVDADWLEGEMNSGKGLVPVTYVEIVQDLQLEHSDTDEWDDDDDDDDDSGPLGTVLCVYKGTER
jgi:neutrophil factor 4